MQSSVVQACVAAIAIKWCVSLWGYSGMNCPPMFGDFEAQRHWLEITTNIDIGDWYRQSVNNDLQYWGLDYPPLTAYVSWIFGNIAKLALPDLVALHTSRGFDNIDGKLFMRLSVIMMDVVIFMPSIILVMKSMRGLVCHQRLKIFSVLICPALILIDHGHFQYNCVCIGLSLLAMYQIFLDRDILGSILFCLALNFKQMTLYYAPVFLFVLLRKCFLANSWQRGVCKVLSLGLTVIGTFAVMWAPFCIYANTADGETCATSLLQVLDRQFPFSRGIFEDKVANLWYVGSVAYDFREKLSRQTITGLSLAATLLLLAPVCSIIFMARRVNLRVMMLSLLTSALAFFLVSFQVHEKSLLLALVPGALLVCGGERNKTQAETLGVNAGTEPLVVTVTGPGWSGSGAVEQAVWLQLLGAFTLFPLLSKDKLRLPYLACCTLYVLCNYCSSASADTDNDNDNEGETTNDNITQPTVSTGTPSSLNVNNNSLKASNLRLNIRRWFLFASYSGMFILHILEMSMPPAARYPDLYPALFSIFGAGNLTVAYVFGVFWLFHESREVKLKNS